MNTVKAIDVISFVSEHNGSRAAFVFTQVLP